MTIKGDRLEAPQLFEAVGQKNQIGTKKKTSNSFEEVMYSMWARINIHIMPVLQKRLLADNARRKGHFAVMC